MWSRYDGRAWFVDDRPDQVREAEIFGILRCVPN